MDHSAHGSHHSVQGFPATPNVLEWAGFAAIFSYSFLVSFHCFGMCGPLACSILSKSKLNIWKSSLLYNLGRGISYCTAGALSALISVSLTNVLPGLTLWISVIFGSLVCIWALVSILGIHQRVSVNPFVKALRSVQDAVLRLPAPLSAFGLGILTIFLPCMTLHPLLLLSAAQQDSFSGAVTMLAFFAGTVPAMVSATFMPTLISGNSHIFRFIRFGQIFLFIAGLLTIGRGFLRH